MQDDLPFKPLDASEVFKAEDFERIEFEVIFKNLATNTAYNENIELTEIHDETVVLQIPPKSSNTGQNALVEIYRKTKDKAMTAKDRSKAKPVLQFTGKVSACEALETSELRITIKLVQFEEKEWLDFLAIFQKRQEEITQFLQSTRGY